MRKILLVLTGAVLFVGCTSETKSDTATSDSTASTTDAAPVTPLAYTPTYSSSFKMGNPEYASMIVQGSWKDWETNNLDNMRNWLADTVVAYHSDNSMVKGLDSLMARWKRGRAGYTSVLDSINAVTSVYSTDKNENWVLVWAKEINTKADGTKDTMYLMETWRINKDGKADLLLQYDRAKRKK
jgi:hypothetical protein